MSKRDIETVCTLAAHLAVIDTVTAAPKYRTVSENRAPLYAADAMKLQRLGRSAMNALDKKSASEAGRSPHAYTDSNLDDVWTYVTDEADNLLRPYALKAECRDAPFRPECLYILGLPPNGDGMGFGI